MLAWRLGGQDDLWGTTTTKDQNSYRAMARAAIEAMREPTVPMYNATFSDEDFATNWRAAIDEALK